MISIQSLRAAVFASDPYNEMHDLVRNEMSAGRKVKEVLDSMSAGSETQSPIPVAASTM